MTDGINIPADMNNVELAKATGSRAVVSLRDMMLLLGASDQDMQDWDERDEILTAEPWRNKTTFRVVGECPNGMKYGFMEGYIDWTGTRFDGEYPKPSEEKSV